MHHVWGLLAHPGLEMRDIKRESESVSYHYTHHVLVLAAIPVFSAFIGTTQLGWDLGASEKVRLELLSALGLAVVFYLVILAGVAVMGRVIYWMARDYPLRPELTICTVFAGYIATPLFISGIVALYPLVWLCVLVCALASVYSGYLLYVGVPHFLDIDSAESLRFSGATLAVGVLVLEGLLTLVVFALSLGYRQF